MQLPTFVKEFELSPLDWHREMRVWSRGMRERDPVWYDAENACWRVFRYDDIERVLNDYKTFSSAYAGHEQQGAATMISMDPPRHQHMRSLGTRVFSARNIAQMAPRIKRIARGLLGNMCQKAEIDIVADFATPLPILVILEMLGMPHERWWSVKELTHALVAHTSNVGERRQIPLDEVVIEEQIIESYNFFFQAVEDHRREPRQDILSLLLEAEIEGKPLSEEELYGFFILLLISGTVTTTQVLGSAFLGFDQHPEAWAQLREEPGLATNAVEEILRYYPPIRGTGGERGSINGRILTCDTILGDQRLREGDVIYGLLLSGNFDERRFAEAERFDLRRTPNKHLTFGHGIHFCLGAALARLEAKIALELLVEYMPEWELLHNEELEMVENHVVFGAKRLPVAINA